MRKIMRQWMKFLKACKFAAADEFIEKLPKKYDTIIGENGIRLSGWSKTKIVYSKGNFKRVSNYSY